MTEDLAAFFDTGPGGFAENVVLAGVTLAAIVDHNTQLVLGDLLQPALSVLLPAASAPSAAEGQSCVVRGVTYRVRPGPRAEPPDRVLIRCFLAREA